MSKIISLDSNFQELGKHTVDEGVQDRHGASRDTSVRVDLLEN